MVISVHSIFPKARVELMPKSTQLLPKQDKELGSNHLMGLKGRNFSKIFI